MSALEVYTLHVTFLALISREKQFHGFYWKCTSWVKFKTIQSWKYQTREEEDKNPEHVYNNTRYAVSRNNVIAHKFI